LDAFTRNQARIRDLPASEGLTLGDIDQAIDSARQGLVGNWQFQVLVLRLLRAQAVELQKLGAPPMMVVGSDEFPSGNFPAGGVIFVDEADLERGQIHRRRR
jgi:hypothetical protein